MVNDPSLQDLRLFCAVARRASFVATASEFGASPTFVSKRIAILESVLGVRLFHRTTRRVNITDDGQKAYRWAKKLLETCEEMSEDLASARGKPEGLLRISTSLRLGRNHVSPVLSLLVRQNPGLEIWLELLDRRADLVAEGFHLDIRVGDVEEPNLIAHKIADSYRVLCAAPEYLAHNDAPNTLADVAQHDCLLFREREEPFGVWRMLGPNGPETVKVTGSMASNHSDIVRGWAHDAHGIIMAAVWDVADALQNGTLVRVLPAWRQPANVWAVTPSRSANSAKVRVCIAFLKEKLTSGPLALVDPANDAPSLSA